jgi:hypothetical protein
MSSPGSENCNSARAEVLRLNFAQNLFASRAIHAFVRQRETFLRAVKYERESRGPKAENCKHKEKLFFTPGHIIDNGTLLRETETLSM